MKNNNILIKKQVKNISKTYIDNGVEKSIFVKIRYDDNCNNGHNTFAITANVYEGKYVNEPKSERNMIGCGCMHDDILKAYPEYKELVKYHLFNNDGRLYYIENTIYFAKAYKEYNYFIYLNYNNSSHILKYIKSDNENDFKKAFNEINKEFKGKDITYKKEKSGMYRECNLEKARNYALWYDATIEQLQSEEALNKRLPFLIKDFKKMLNSLNLI